MEAFRTITSFYSRHRDYIDFIKEVIYFVALVYGYIRFLIFLRHRETLNKIQEMRNDLEIYEDIKKELKEFVDSYEANSKKLRDIGIRLLYIKNYPYKLEKDGYKQMLYYYFLTENHKATGYITSKGLYVMEHLWYYSNSIYYNSQNCKWFVDKKDRKHKNYIELKHKQLVKRIPFTNIYGYDFNCDWSEKGEPVFYTKYKYSDFKLFAEDMEAVSIDQENHLAYKVSLNKNKMTRRTRMFLQNKISRIKYYFMEIRTRNEAKDKS